MVHTTCDGREAAVAVIACRVGGCSRAGFAIQAQWQWWAHRWVLPAMETSLPWSAFQTCQFVSFTQSRKKSLPSAGSMAGENPSITSSSGHISRLSLRPKPKGSTFLFSLPLHHLSFQQTLSLVTSILVQLLSQPAFPFVDWATRSFTGDVWNLYRWHRGKRICLPKQETQDGFNPSVGWIPWRREWQPSPVLLPGESHGQRSLVSYSPRGRKESDTAEHPHMRAHTHTIWPKKEPTDVGWKASILRTSLVILRWMPMQWLCFPMF